MITKYFFIVNIVLFSTVFLHVSGMLKKFLEARCFRHKSIFQVDNYVFRTHLLVINCNSCIFKFYLFMLTTYRFCIIDLFLLFLGKQRLWRSCQPNLYEEKISQCQLLLTF